jgi:predicted transcriptional regulator
MITFSCKNITEEELTRCSFNLSKTEYNVLIFLLKNYKRHTVLHLSNSIKLERTTIQKAVKGLVEKGLVDKIQKNLPKGGYIFLYKAKYKEEIKSKIKKLAHKWYKDFQETIDKL